MVLEQEMFRRKHETSQMEDVNWGLWFKVILAKNPKPQDQTRDESLGTTSSREDKGTASGHGEVWWRMVNR